MMQAPLLHPASMGALTQLWAGTTPDGLGLGGEVSFLISNALTGMTLKRAETVSGAVGEVGDGARRDAGPHAGQEAVGVVGATGARRVNWLYPRMHATPLYTTRRLLDSTVVIDLFASPARNACVGRWHDTLT